MIKNSNDGDCLVARLLRHPALFARIRPAGAWMADRHTNEMQKRARRSSRWSTHLDLSCQAMILFSIASAEPTVLWLSTFENARNESMTIGSFLTVPESLPVIPLIYIDHLLRCAHSDTLTPRVLGVAHVIICQCSESTSIDDEGSCYSC